MVTVLQNENQDISMLQSAIAGGAAGSVTRTIAQPLDVLKIRFQLQVEPISYGSKYSSIIQATRSIIREEGLTTLWSGHIPAQFLSISYGVIQFTVFEQIVNVSAKANHELYEAHKNTVNFAAGAIAATVGATVSFPFDTIRTRLIAEQKTKKVYKGVLDAFNIMIKNEGPKSLFKGLIPTLSQIAPHAGIQFAVYKFLTERVLTRVSIFQRHTNNEYLTHNISASIISGSIAGLISKIAIYPCDLVKKRLQIQGFQQHRSAFGKQMYCNGLLDCIKLLVIQEGFSALYKGLGPSLLKAVLVSALHFAVYDEIKFFFLKRIL